MPDPKPIKKERLLVVEGEEGRKFFEAFLREMALAEEIQVQNFGGINELRSFLKALKNTPGFHIVYSLGIIRDAEEDPVGARQSVSDALANAGLPVPGEGPLPNVSILILPDGNAPGMLEDLCLASISDDPVRECIDQYCDCLKRVGSLPTKLAKAQVHAYLASRTRPDLSLGNSARAGYWPLDNPTFEHVRSFLAAL